MRLLADEQRLAGGEPLVAGADRGLVIVVSMAFSSTSRVYEVGGVSVDAPGLDEPHPFMALVSPNRRRPAPSTTGKTFSRSSSTRSCSSRVWAIAVLAGDEDVPVDALLQPETSSSRSPVSTVVLFQAGVEGRRHDVLGHAVQPVGERAGPRRPPTREPLVGPSAHQHRVAAQSVVEREPAELRAVLDRSDPAAALEVLVARRILE